MGDKPMPATRTYCDSLESAGGAVRFAKLEPLSDKPGFEAYLVPWYTLSDRGTFFVPGSLKRSANGGGKSAPHLWQHDTWEPIGKHEAALEDENGFRIAVHLNEGTQRGAETLSNLRMGVPLGVSIGFDPIRTRSGEEKDGEKLDRSTAPGWLKNVPITDLTAITEARFWESSTVTFPGIGSAKPDMIHAGDEYLSGLLARIESGEATALEIAAAREIAAKLEALPGPGASYSTNANENRRRAQLTAITAVRARLIAQGIS